MEYDYRDIWGNLRLSFRDSLATPVNGIYAPPVVKQTADFDMLGYELATSLQGKNNYKFQGQERVKDFELDIDLFQYRPSDSKIGRFWQIDPLSSQYAHNSPYALQENKFGRGVELEGLELASFLSKVGDFMSGSNAAFADDQLPFPTKIREVAAKGKDQASFRAGEAFGDGLALVQGAGETLLGLGGGAGAAVATAVSVGTAGVVTVPVAVASTAVAVHGAGVAVKAAKNISDRMTNTEGGKNDGTFGSGKDTNGNGSTNASFRSAKDRNGIPRSQQPDKTIKPNTLDGDKAKLDSRNVKQYDFTNSKGQKKSIREDKAAKYNDGGKGDQGKHHNAGNPGEKLDQHHNN